MTRPGAPEIEGRRRLSRNLAHTGLVALVWAVLMVGAPELLLRAFADPPSEPTPIVGNRRFVEWLTEQSVATPDGRSLYRPDRQLIWSLEPGARIDTTSQHYDRRVGESQAITISINRDGYRGPLMSAGDETRGPRVLCMGDSNFFGYPLGDDDAFPRMLEAELATNGEGLAEVINGATPGYTVVQGWRWYEERFRDYPYDVLLLSYLNNDAWPQPRADTDTLAAHAARWRPAFALAERLWVVRWVRARRATEAVESLVARVDLETFEERHNRFIADARSRGAQVLLIDHRAYAEYAPYTRVLRRLAADPDVGWLPVQRTLRAQFSVAWARQRHPDLAERVRNRWGTDKLQRRPYLWYYAEMHPEHLNELGNAFLAALVRGEGLGRR